MDKFLGVKVVGIDGDWILVKIPRKRKIRRMVALEFDDGDAIILQGDKTILRIDLKKEVEGGYIARYNDKGEYFMYLSPIMGAKDVVVPKEFVEKVKEVMYRKGDLIGIMPSDVGPTRVFYGGGKTF